MNFGGPTLGFMSTKENLLRNLPGRICGQSKDKDENDYRNSTVDDELLFISAFSDDGDEKDEEIEVLPHEIPTDFVDPSAADSMIAQQMNRLSIREREKVLYDLHGIQEGTEETPDLIYSALIQLEEEIRCISHKDAYEVALAQDATYVQNEEFRLKFLRAEEFDPKKTALRLVRHFQAKSELFGSKKLTKTIVQDDLSEGDMEVLYSGGTQTLPARDNAGRVVMIWFANLEQNMYPQDSLVCLNYSVINSIWLYLF